MNASANENQNDSDNGDTAVAPMVNVPPTTQVEKTTVNGQPCEKNRIIKRFGGRHLIFRTKVGGWRILPKPYILVSSFRGVVWVFYGAGQVWLTHHKLREIDGWMARVPRIFPSQVVKIMDAIEPELSAFITHCNEQGIDGTVVIEKRVIEFHWTFGHELETEKIKKENAGLLDQRFETLVNAYLKAKEELSI
jgi:hypothetical protein